MTDINATQGPLVAAAAALESRSRVEDLCVELLVYILSFLHPKDIASCRRISRMFFLAVKESVQLQWAIECYSAGVEDCHSTTLNLQERVDNLRLWRDARRNPVLQPTSFPESNFASTAVSMINMFGTTFTLLHGDTVSIFQPALKRRGLPSREWTVTLGFSGDTVEAVAYDDQNQLLVVVENAAQHDVYNIHFYSTVTGGRHPLTHSSPLSMPASQHPPHDILDPDNIVSVSVCDSALAVQVSGLEFYPFAEICVWDWKTGDILLNIHGTSEVAEPRDIKFMDPDHCIVSFDHSQENADVSTHGVAVFSLRPGNSSRQECSVALNNLALLKLQLPEVKDDVDALVSVTIGLPPCPSRTQTHEGAFRLRDDSRLLHIDYTLESQIDEEIAYNLDIVTPIESIYALLKLSAPPTPQPLVVPWHVWRFFTRVFTYGESISAERFITGTQYVIAQRSNAAEPCWTFKIHDFGRAATTSAGDAEHDQSLVREPFELRIRGRSPWKSPVKDSPSLPYRVSTCKMKGLQALGPLELVYPGEEYMVVVGNNRRKVYTFDW